MNAKDLMIEAVQQESVWFELAKTLTRVEVARLLEQRRASAQTQEVSHAQVHHRDQVSQASGA